MAAVCSQGCTPRSAAVDFLLDIIADAVVDCFLDITAAAVVDSSRDITAVVVLIAAAAADCWHA